MLLPALLAAAAYAWVPLGTTWQSSTATLQLQLGAPPYPLEDGSPSWDASAAEALRAWNAHLEAFQLSWTIGSSAGRAPRDGVNSMFFSETVYGQSFGSNTLAVALVWSSESDRARTVEGDVIFNQARSFNSFRGPRRFSPDGNEVYDLHRVVLHEVGHVLGLGHPNETDQSPPAVMRAVIGDIDSLQPDDVAGVKALYGYRITSRREAYVQQGLRFTYQTTVNFSGATFSASGLPEGLNIDPSTGLISGVCTAKPNIYLTEVTAVAGHFRVSGTIRFIVTGDGTEFITALDVAADRLLADPHRPRVYATVPASDSVVVIDTASLSVIARLPIGPKPMGMSISPDNRILYVANFGSSAGSIGRVDLETLTVLPPLAPPGQVAEVAAGLDQRLYVGGRESWGVAQISAVDGSWQTGFVGNIYAGVLAISPDRRTVFVGNKGVSPSSLQTYDVSTPTPALLQRSIRDQYGGSAMDFALSHNAAYYALSGDEPFAKLWSATDINRRLGSYYFPNGKPGAVTFSADDSVVYVANLYHNEILCFDTRTFSSRGLIRLGGNSTFNLARDLVVDTSGERLFVAISDNFAPSALRVYAATPPLPAPATAPARSLLNVSTRAYVRGGENALIGGFIIEGDLSKRVMLRALGRSLPVPKQLADPRLTLVDSSGRIVAANDNWTENEQEVNETGLRPSGSGEAALAVLLAPGAYTVVVQGNDYYRDGDPSGVALVELYDLEPARSRVVNISTRAKVETGDDVMIGGFIVGGEESTRVVVRAIGPSLAPSGVAEALADPTLELRDGNGALAASNDNWRATQEREIIESGVPPADDRESAVVVTIAPGNYTAIVRGKGDLVGVGLVEVYNLR